MRSDNDTTCLLVCGRAVARVRWLVADLVGLGAMQVVRWVGDELFLAGVLHARSAVHTPSMTTALSRTLITTREVVLIGNTKRWAACVWHARLTSSVTYPSPSSHPAILSW
ncbi:hypothetical protein GOP47_0019714 [Adiantum capillus-veneris]|uniref:Uncharacterized protein n=1 Tax=Adiantum capillus-veneris TaxID=13818 RepID=A0A9D4Z818_ADICA|nr:hypothetical protein GOP47_0019714 [Adiantum capillus-veneris]